MVDDSDMSAYGSIAKPVSSQLRSTIWPVSASALRDTRTTSDTHLTIHHLTLSAVTTSESSDLISHLHRWFAHEVEEGLTYPQEGEVQRDAFESYFFAADVFIAIVGTKCDGLRADGEDVKMQEIESNVEQARCGRPWDNCVAGFYYVKPNYPGRSSHICNGGFIVPPSQRGHRYGTVLAQSFLHYAPRLGYEASVFNLVYVNNTASVRLWESLDFTKAGVIPRAGRLRKRNGEGEEYVDAFIFYKQFK